MNTKTKVPKRRALMSVTDKTGIAEFAHDLSRLGWEIISTGGTARTLKDFEVPVTAIEEVTQFPEMLDGRVKTLHPKVHGGLLARRDLSAHMETIAAHGINPIDLIVVNLYDFASKPDIEQIDIGGPAMLRSAAKNGASVVVVVDSADYPEITRQIREQGSVDERTRERMTAKVFNLTAGYDAMIADWMNTKLEKGERFLHPAVAAH
jgi:phosphoribosylaminoimidazolecarboxamide formyltransferase / IMP cyclohydrolase